MNAQLHQGQLRSLATQIRIACDEHTKAVRANLPDSQPKARQFCRFIFNSYVLGLLRAMVPLDGKFGADDLERDMMALRELVKGPLNEGGSCDLSDVLRRLTAIEENLQILAGHVAGLSSYGTNNHSAAARSGELDSNNRRPDAHHWKNDGANVRTLPGSSPKIVVRISGGV